MTLEFDELGEDGAVLVDDDVGNVHPGDRHGMSSARHRAAALAGHYTRGKMGENGEQKRVSVHWFARTKMHGHPFLVDNVPPLA